MFLQITSWCSSSVILPKEQSTLEQHGKGKKKRGWGWGGIYNHQMFAKFKHVNELKI